MEPDIIIDSFRAGIDDLIEDFEKFSIVRNIYCTLEDGRYGENRALVVNFSFRGEE